MKEEKLLIFSVLMFVVFIALSVFLQNQLSVGKIDAFTFPARTFHLFWPICFMAG